MTTWVAATKWLPFTISVTPCCTSAKVIVLGESEPISGAGLALPQRGFRVLLPQPGRKMRASRAARYGAQVRDGMPITPHRASQLLDAAVPTCSSVFPPLPMHGG